MNTPDRLRAALRQASREDQHLIGWALGSFLALAAVVIVGLHFLAPLPPSTLVMTTGAPGGAYAIYAERYRDVLARHGVRVILSPSSGSVENLRRLKGVDGKADVGFIQGGIVNEPESRDLATLGAMYYEPLWVFVRDDVSAERVADLRQNRIAVGLHGGGAQLLVLEVLTANGFAIDSPLLVPLAGDEAFAALQQGKVDALMTVNGAEAPIVKKLLHADKVRLLHFDQADAYTRRLPQLSRLVLPRGAIDLVSDSPAEDVPLVAATANLVVQADLHPALVSLLMQAASEIHRAPGLFEKGNEFPAPRDHELPDSAEASRFYRSGPPLLQRILPFWAAVMLDRALWTLLPLLAVLVPTIRLAPALLRWRNRSRIYRWYGELKFIEQEARRLPDPARVPGWIERLDAIEQQALKRKVPLAYANELYILREHIGLVRGIVQGTAAS